MGECFCVLFSFSFFFPKWRLTASASQTYSINCASTKKKRLCFSSDLFASSVVGFVSMQKLLLCTNRGLWHVWKSVCACERVCRVD